MCNHCHISPTLRHSNPQERSLDQLTLDFKRLKEIGAESIILSGGEPTEHNQFLSVAALAKRLFSKATVISNGVNPDLIREVIGYGVGVYISLDYYGNHQDQWRGCRGLWQNYLSLQDSVNARCTLLKNNVADLEAILANVVEHGKTATVTPYRGNDANLTPTTQEIGQLLRFIFRDQKHVDGIVIDDCATRMYLKYKGLIDKPYVGCDALAEGLTISANGKVRPCPFLPQEITDLHDIYLTEKLEKTRDAIKHVYTGKCQKCSHNQSCGGCRASTNNHCLLK